MLLSSSSNTPSSAATSSSHIYILSLFLTVRNMSLGSHIIESPSAVWARSPIVILLYWSAVATTCSSTAVPTFGTCSRASGSSHGGSKHFRLSFPFGSTCQFASSHHYSLILSFSWHLLRLHLFSSLGLHNELLLLAGNDSVGLTIEDFTLLLEHLLADARVLGVGFIVESSSATWTLI